MKTRIALFVVFLVAAELIYSAFAQIGDPIARTNLATNTVNGGAYEWGVMRSYDIVRSNIRSVLLLTYVAAFALLILRPLFIKPKSN